MGRMGTDHSVRAVKDRDIALEAFKFGFDHLKNLEPCLLQHPQVQHTHLNAICTVVKTLHFHNTHSQKNALLLGPLHKQVNANQSFSVNDPNSQQCC